MLAFSADEKAKSGRRAVIVFSMRVISAVLAYFLQVFLARYLGTTEFGIYVAVWTWVILLGTLSSFGINTSVIRFASEYTEMKDWGRLKGIVIGSPILAIALTTLIAILGVLGIYFFGDILDSYYIIPIYLAMICVPMFALTDVSEGIARGMEWSNLAIVPIYILRPLFIMIFMLIAVIFIEDRTATVAMSASIFATWLVALGQYFTVFKRSKQYFTKDPAVYEPKYWLKVSMPILLVEGFYLLLAYTDIVFLQIYMAPEAIAIYFAAIKTTVLVAFVAYAVRVVYEPRYSKLYHSGDQKGFEELVGETVHMTFWPSVAALLLILATGHLFLSFFGEGFLEGYSLLFILALGLMARASVGPAASLLMMTNAQNEAAKAYIAAFVINIILNISLIPTYGLTGAAMATAYSMMIETLGLAWLAHNHTSINVFIFSIIFDKYKRSRNPD